MSVLSFGERLSRVLTDRGRLCLGIDPHAWLLSATLARRQDDLAGAQGFIEQAAALDPRDPAIGLEAGIVAALGGRDDAARKSFESVVAADASGPYGALARTYLQQLGR